MTMLNRLIAFQVLRRTCVVVFIIELQATFLHQTATAVVSVPYSAEDSKACANMYFIHTCPLFQIFHWPFNRAELKHMFAETGGKWIHFFTAINDFPDWLLGVQIDIKRDPVNEIFLSMQFHRQHFSRLTTVQLPAHAD